MPTLVLLRHGQSEWNEQNLFTGWHDVALTARGEREAIAAGTQLAQEQGLDLRVLHTSVLTRAIRTAELALAAAGRSWLPVRRSWQLNERHYGDLTGKNKKEVAAAHGMDQLVAWRRSYDVPPPPMPVGDPRRSDADPRYRDVPRELLPATECLADVVARVVPYYEAAILPDLVAEGPRGGAVLVAAHGNSLRALRMHLESISPTAIVELEIPTGIAFSYRFDDAMRITDARYLGDEDAAKAAADEVARQAG